LRRHAIRFTRIRRARDIQPTLLARADEVIE
jgi:hypothetical protein